MSRRLLPTLLWSAGGALLGLGLGLLCTLMFEGIGFAFGIGIGIALAAALGFAGFLYARDRSTRS
ncbi:hypothetical protein HQQ80_07585 [Microbacteriaceae bacterium VKM Ac-2855]|nr:hypothetical protein [Microbacteriaceae bacterium VKM Ac-2855]